MKSLVLLVLVCCCSAAVQVLQPNFVVVPYPVAQQYRGQDALGQSTFAHFSFDHAQQQTRLADGSVVGYYSYLGADGKPAVTTYTAGRQGFQVTGSNILPEAPEVPPAPELKAPTPVEETAEVQKARQEFQQKFDEATSGSRVRRSVPVFYTHPVATVATHKFQTKQFEPVEAKTPADTKKVELTTKDHEVSVPAFSFVQPVIGVTPGVGVKPVTYTAASPAVISPYTFPVNPFFPSVFPSVFPVAVPKAEE